MTSHRPGFLCRRRRLRRRRQQFRTERSSIPRRPHPRWSSPRLQDTPQTTVGDRATATQTATPHTTQAMPFVELRHMVPRNDLLAEVTGVCELVGASLWKALDQVRLLGNRLSGLATRLERARINNRKDLEYSLGLQFDILSGVLDQYLAHAQRRERFLEGLTVLFQSIQPGPHRIHVNTGRPGRPATIVFN